MANLDPTQLEQLRSIGEYLSQVRQEQGRSLEELGKVVFIRPSLLQAIEAGDGEALPEAIFVRGFIRRYGEALKLDGMALSDEFFVQGQAHNSPAPSTPAGPTTPALPVTPKTPSAQAEPTLAPSPPVSKAPAPAASGMTASGRTASSPESLTPHPSTPAEANPTPALKPLPQPSRRRTRRAIAFPVMPVVAILVVLVGIGGVIGLTNLANRDEGQLTEEETSAPPSADDSQPPEPVVEDPAPAIPPGVVQISLSLTGDSWMRVTVDGQVDFEGILSQGEERTWQADDEVSLTLGNAGAVLLSVNGQAAEPAGGLGAVTRLTFSADDDGEATL